MKGNDFLRELQSAGIKAISGAGNTFWLTHERFSMLRLPASVLARPSVDEISKIFRYSRSAVLSYAVTPSEERPANAVAYVCKDPKYSLEQLERPAQIARGLKEFEITFLDHADVFSLGRTAYYDTLARNGSSFGHESFEKLFKRPRRDRRYLGAVKNERLAAFLQITHVDDWASIGGYSANEFLPLRPNNALVFYAVHHYITEENVRVVDYGFSSIQAVSKSDGLHRFKLKMGFEAIPVHRAFVVHPMLRPLVNQVSITAVRQLLRISPRIRLLQKAEGALRMAVGTSL